MITIEIYKELPPFGAKIGADICPWSFSVPRSEQFSESCELRGTDNVQAQISEHIFAPNGGYCVYSTLTVLKIEEYHLHIPEF